VPGAPDRSHLTYDYWRYAGRDFTQFYEVLFERMKPVPPVLELGSGLGYFLECCRRHGMPALGMESSGEGTAEAALRALPVVRADVTVPFPFKSGTFGSAFSSRPSRSRDASPSTTERCAGTDSDQSSIAASLAGGGATVWAAARRTDSHGISRQSATLVANRLGEREMGSLTRTPQGMAHPPSQTGVGWY